MKPIHSRLTLRGLAASKAQRFQDEVLKHRATTNLTEEWLYARLRALLTPSDFIACETCGMGTMPEAITIDHIFPKSKHKMYKGNIHDTTNLQLICPSCNSAKGQRSLEEFLKILTKKNDDIYRLRSSGGPGDPRNTEREIIAPPYPHIGYGRNLFGTDAFKPEESTCSTGFSKKRDSTGTRHDIVREEDRRKYNEPDIHESLEPNKTLSPNKSRKLRKNHKRSKGRSKKISAGSSDTFT